MYDVIIVGGGPAGLTAAVYACRAGKTVLIIEKETAGGQITFSPMVENIPGFTEISGMEFADKLVDQALSQGAEMDFAEVTGIEDHGDHKTVVLDQGERSEDAKAVIIATGAKHRKLGLPKEEDFIGSGISFCAVCDGAFYKDQVVGMVGGGNSALVEAVLLADLVKKLYIFQDLPMLTGEKKLQEALYAKDNVEVICGVHVKEYLGDEALKGVVIEDADGVRTSYDLDGLFVAIGLVPQNEAFTNVVALNAYGYADVNEFCRTKTPGVFVAGDCRSKFIRQVTTAAADGAIAALAACDFVDGRG
ncbi:MAG: FAD-dependent oxidoreductase [Lachnospiraceae bacterium]|nr:FAD-dependent oxidoreductase [Lachnospiraceae bacterium]